MFGKGKIKKSIILFLAFYLSVDFFVSPLSVEAAAWVNPNSTPPGNNTFRPINAGPNHQRTEGTLVIGAVNYLATTTQHGLIIERGRFSIGSMDPGHNFEVLYPPAVGKVYFGNEDIGTSPYNFDVRFSDINFNSPIRVGYPTAGVHAARMDWVLGELAAATSSQWITDGNNMYNANSGNIGIGTNAPDNSLHVYDADTGGSSHLNARITIEDTANNALQFLTANTGASYIMFGDSGDNYIGGIRYRHPENDLMLRVGDQYRLTIASDGDVGIGTIGPSSKLHIQDSLGKTESDIVSMGASNLIIESSYGARTPGTGAALGFAVPANTDGSGMWEQGRILVTPDNATNNRAEGRMYLQTRYYTGTAWDWRNGVVVDSAGNVGIGADAPASTLDVLGEITVSGSDFNGGINILGNNRIEMQQNHFVNRRFEMIQNANPQYILLCANAANNDVNGTIRMDRTSGNYQAVTLDVIVTGGTSAMFGGTLRTLQFLQGTTNYDLVTVTYGGTSYVAIKYTGNSYPESTGAYFTGRILDTTGDAFTVVDNTGITDEAPFNNATTLANFDVTDFSVSGDVAIGTTYPAGGYALDVRGASIFSSQLTIPSTPVGDTDAASKGYVDGLILGADFWNATGVNNGIYNTNSGTVGIGISTPDYAYTLHVEGDTYINGNLTMGTGGDLAEEFVTDMDYEPGTVLVMDDNGFKSAKACSREYDTAVIGVISDMAALVMGRVEGEHEAIVALTGVVRVKVNNSNGLIKKGDLITSSDFFGEAMKATNLQLGTIIGKALESASGVKDEIMVLVNLQ